MDADRLRHAHSHHPERALSESHRRGAGLQFRVDQQQPLAFAKILHRGPPKFVENPRTVLVHPGVLRFDESFIVRILETQDPLMCDPCAAAILPKVDPVHELMGKPDGVVVAV